MQFMATISLSLISLILCGCATNAGTGAITGCVLGTGLGSAISGGNGALYGGVSSVLVASLIGYVLDQEDRKVVEKTSPRTVDRMDKGDPLTINDVIKLSQSGIGDEMIIRYMRDSGSYYSLSQAQMRRLQESGVSQDVINYMIETGR